MKSRAMWAWLPGEVVELLRRQRRECGVTVSSYIRECVLQRLQDEDVDQRVRRALLEHERDALLQESKNLRRVQNSILADFVFLRDYAAELVKGGFKNPSFGQLRRSILRYENGEKALGALEHLFSRRQSIGARLCEITVELYPENRYERIGRLRREYQKEHTRRLRSRSPAGDAKLVGGDKRRW